MAVLASPTGRNRTQSSSESQIGTPTILPSSGVATISEMRQCRKQRGQMPSPSRRKRFLHGRVASVFGQLSNLRSWPTGVR